MTPSKKAITAVYFAFTSLSTVGFGDYVPRSNLERIVATIMLVFGVSIFSFIMNEFVNMITVIQNFQSDFDESDNLNKFFGVLEKYNNNHPINLDLKRKIESHFNYKWKSDKSMAITES
jgi:Na+-transporting NADH:ubiquinone oxidoreductase subunit NqrC